MRPSTAAATLPPGTRLGRYEVQREIGSGGMGQVYRGRDAQLQRDVAIKVLPATGAATPERLLRFEQEARAAAALNHPNLLAVYDIGVHEGRPYVVFELLLGETLREALREGPLTPRKAISAAIRIARGLVAAHNHGVVHRDLKPENLFITQDGGLKILDFGLAKLVLGDHERAPESALATSPGVVLGTAAYMAPEQIRGQSADHRCDIFAFGAILFEVLVGARPFVGHSSVEVMSAILRDDPLDLTQLQPAVPSALERIVRRCLEKRPEDRFQSTSDLLFALEAIPASFASRPAMRMRPLAPARNRRWPARTAMTLLFAWSVVAAWLITSRTAPVASPVASPTTAPTAQSAPARARQPHYRRLTFRRGHVWSARFSPDGHTIVYAASWDGAPAQLYSTRADSTESRALGLGGAVLASVSRSAELAVLREHHLADNLGTGTLARLPLAGGMPRDVLAAIDFADWLPDSDTLAIVRDVAGKSRLEVPAGTMLKEAAGWFSHPRVAPGGDGVAVIEHAARGDDRGQIVWWDAKGGQRLRTREFVSAQGLAWVGDEVWFTASEQGVTRALYAVGPRGEPRLITRVPGTLTLHDSTARGALLLTTERWRVGLAGRGPGETRERDLSWLDQGVAVDLSADGKTVLFGESGDGAGPKYAIYLRGTNGSAPTRLGAGNAAALSPDGHSVIAFPLESVHHRLTLLPTGVGEARELTFPALALDRFAAWFADGRRVLLSTSAPGQGRRYYVHNIAGGAPRAIPPTPGAISAVLSPDDSQLAVMDAQHRIWRRPLSAGPPAVVPGKHGDVRLIRWTADGHGLFVWRAERAGASVHKLDVRTGARVPWLRIQPDDAAAIRAVTHVLLSADGRTYVYTYNRVLSDLHLVTGLR